MKNITKLLIILISISIISGCANKPSPIIQNTLVECPYPNEPKYEELKYGKNNNDYNLEVLTYNHKLKTMFIRDLLNALNCYITQIKKEE